MNATVLFGTRPEAIKLAPVIREMRVREGVSVQVVTTGQHRELVEQALQPFGLSVDVNLAVMQPKQTLAALSSRLLPALMPMLEQHRPDVIVVQGDTTSTFLSALASFYSGVPVAHVEAGLRTDNPAQPFPEEINRRLTSVLAAVHFAPTEKAKHNLLAEGVAEHEVFVTGNTVVDALQFILASAAFHGTASPVVPGSDERLLLVTLHRRESWGTTLDAMCRALKTLITRHPNVRIVIPVHPNPVVRESVTRSLLGVDRVSLLEPLDYMPFLALMNVSWLVLTDSGGVQEEAPVLGKPVLVLRDVTERPEAIDAGVAALVGTSESGILDAIEGLLASPGKRDAMARRVSPFGDGHAARTIVDVLQARYGGEANAKVPRHR